MTAALSLLLVQCLLGACDTVWHHEITERLPQKRSARRELLLHAARHFLYGLTFLGLAWREWRGLWAWALAAVLLIEILLTLADFLEEDRTRRLPATERVLHTVLAVNYGIWLGVFLPRLGAWSSEQTSLPRADYGTSIHVQRSGYATPSISDATAARAPFSSPARPASSAAPWCANSWLEATASSF